MSGPRYTDDSHDDFTAEVSELRPNAAPVPTERQAPFLSHERQTPRLRVARLLVIVLAPALVLVIVLGANPALRAGLDSLVSGSAPVATLAAPPADATPSIDLFYLLPNPPGVDVSLDGHILAHPPAPGDPHPLKLSPGRHTFAWRSRSLPFLPLKCNISVPPLVSDDCPIVPPHSLPFQLVAGPGTVIGTHESLSTLQRRSDADKLSAAIQAALDAIRSTATVQPGESYMASNTDYSLTIARQPLRAMREYWLDHDTGFPEPCIPEQPAIPCRFPGQDCNNLCTVEQPPASVAGPDNAWIAAAFVRPIWTYYTADGRHFVAQVFENFGLVLAVLRITHEAGQWHVSAIVGHTPGLAAADDLACDPARSALSRTVSWTFMLTNPPPGAQVHFISDATPADGCAISLSQGQGEAALFLQRFGVLMTANDTARNPVDNLPVADPTEQALAQQIFAQSQV
jgi:hypothetical protein